LNNFPSQIARHRKTLRFFRSWEMLKVKLEDERLKERMKIKKGLLFGTILVLFLFFFASVPTNVIADPGIWVYYDRNDRDVVLKNTQSIPGERWAVRFSLPSYPPTNVFDIIEISMMIAGGSQYLNEFSLEITDIDHNLIFGVGTQSTTPDEWDSVSLRGIPHTRITEEFHVELIPELDTTGNIFRSTGLWLDEDDAPSGKSYWYTWVSIPPIPNMPPLPPFLAWLPIENGDLMIRVELEPVLPESIVNDLKDIVIDADDSFFNGYAHNKVQQQKKTILKKLDVVINDFEECNYQGGYKKLENDIMPKLADPRPTPLADPRPTPRTFWLHKYPTGSQNQQAVSEFANECLELFELIQLADPRPTP